MLLEGNGLYPPLIILPHGGGVREFICRCTSADAIGDTAPAAALGKTVTLPSLPPSPPPPPPLRQICSFFLYGTGKQSDLFPLKIHAQVALVKLNSGVLNGLLLFVFSLLSRERAYVARRRRASIKLAGLTAAHPDPLIWLCLNKRLNVVPNHGAGEWNCT